MSLNAVFHLFVHRKSHIKRRIVWKSHVYGFSIGALTWSPEYKLIINFAMCQGILKINDLSKLQNILKSLHDIKSAWFHFSWSLKVWNIGNHFEAIKAFLIHNFQIECVFDQVYFSKWFCVFVKFFCTRLDISWRTESTLHIVKRFSRYVLLVFYTLLLLKWAYVPSYSIESWQDPHVAILASNGNHYIKGVKN